jgi:hypothetical protein
MLPAIESTKAKTMMVADLRADEVPRQSEVTAVLRGVLC